MTDQEHVNEKISALMDGELREREADPVIAALACDDESRKTWERYHLAVDAWKKNLSTLPLHHSLSDRVMQSLESEPVVFAPSNIPRRIHPMLKQAVGLAVAASVTAVAILGVQSWNVAQTPAAAVAQQGVPAMQAVAAAPASVAEVKLAAEKDVAPANSQMQEYLVRHNQYALGVHGVLPYARIVGYTPETSE